LLGKIKCVHWLNLRTSYERYWWFHRRFTGSGVDINTGNGDYGVMAEIDWRQECARLHIELDATRAEMEDWKIKWERLMEVKQAPRLPVRGRSTLTTMVWDGDEDGK
jgi:hypothetical protein